MKNTGIVRESPTSDHDIEISSLGSRYETVPQMRKKLILLKSALFLLLRTIKRISVARLCCKTEVNEIC